MSDNIRRLAAEIAYPSFAVELPDTQVYAIDRALSSLTLYSHQVHFDFNETLDEDTKWKRQEHVETKDFYEFYAGTSPAAIAYRKEQNIAATETAAPQELRETVEVQERPDQYEKTEKVPPPLPARDRQEHAVPGTGKYKFKVPPPYVPPPSQKETRLVPTPPPRPTPSAEPKRVLPPPPPRVDSSRTYPPPGPPPRANSPLTYPPLGPPPRVDSPLTYPTPEFPPRVESPQTYTTPVYQPPPRTTSNPDPFTPPPPIAQAVPTPGPTDSKKPLPPRTASAPAKPSYVPPPPLPPPPPRADSVQQQTSPIYYPPPTLPQQPHRTQSGFAPGSFHGTASSQPPAGVYSPSNVPSAGVYNGPLSYYPPPPQTGFSPAPSSNFAQPPPGSQFQLPPTSYSYQPPPPASVYPPANVYGAPPHQGYSVPPSANTASNQPPPYEPERQPSYVSQSHAIYNPLNSRHNSTAGSDIAKSDWDNQSVSTADSGTPVHGGAPAVPPPSYSLAPKPGHESGQLPPGARASHQHKEYGVHSAGRVPAWYTPKEQEGGFKDGKKVAETIPPQQLETKYSSSSYEGQTWATLIPILEYAKARVDCEEVIKVAKLMLNQAPDRKYELDCLQEIGEALLWLQRFDEAETVARELYEGRHATLDPRNPSEAPLLYRSVALLTNICDVKNTHHLGRRLGDVYCAELPPTYPGPIYRNFRHEWLLAFGWFIAPDGRSLNSMSPAFTIHDIAFESIYNGDVHVLRIALALGVNVNSHAYATGWTLLTTAAAGGLYDAVGSLLTYGADANIKSADNYTPLMAAAGVGNMDLVRLLVDRGAKVKDKTQTHRLQAIHYAASGGHLDVTQFLLDKGAPTHSLFHVEPTPLHYAAAAGHVAVMELLLRYHAPPYWGDNTGQYPLHWAAQGGFPECIQLLLHHGAKVDKKDNAGMSALDHAVMSGHFQAAKCLVELGADFRRPRVLPWNYYSRSPEELAAQKDRTLERREIWKFLEAQGSGINFLSIEEEASMIAEDTVASDFMSRRLHTGYARPY